MSASYPFKVIEIIDDTKIIINAGEEDDLYVGQSLNIVKKGTPVRDLDGSELGTYDLIIERIMVNQVYSRFSICIKSPASSSSAYLNPVTVYNAAISANPPKMRVNMDKASHRKYPDQKIIEVGDDVVFTG